MWPDKLLIAMAGSLAPAVVIRPSPAEFQGSSASFNPPSSINLLEWAGLFVSCSCGAMN